MAEGDEDAPPAIRHAPRRRPVGPPRRLPVRDEVRLGSLKCGAAGHRRGHGRQGGLAGRTGSPQSQKGVGPPRQRPGVADLVGGHHEDVERRSQGAPGPPPGGRGGEAPGRSSGPVGRRPARCRWKRNPPCARPVRRRGPAGHLSGDRTTVASVTVFGAVGDLAVSQPERAVAAFAAAQRRRPPASPRGSAAAQLTRVPAGPRQHWSIRVASLIPSWLRGSNPPSKGPSPGGSTRGVRRAASSSEVDGGCRRAGEESACSPVTGIVVVFGRREQRPPSPSSEESYWPALPRRRGGEADQAAGPADRGNEDSVPSALRPGTHVQGSSSCPTDSAYADNAGSLDISPPHTTPRQALHGALRRPLRWCPCPCPCRCGCRRGASWPGGLLAVPQSGREAPWATQDGAGAECAVEAAGDTAGAAVLLPGLPGRRAPWEQPICVAAAVAVTR